MPQNCQTWVLLADRIFDLLIGSTKVQVLTIHQCQFFLLGLLMHEITEQNLPQMPTLIRQQVSQLMTQLNHCEGFVSRRCFKQYLLDQRLTQTNDLNELKHNIEIILEHCPNQLIPDIMQEVLNQVCPNERIHVDEVFQGLQYLLNQKTISQALIGGYFDQSKFKDVAVKLGQYLYVVHSQHREMHERPQAVMARYGRVIEQVLREYDSRLNNNLSSLSYQILKSSENEMAIS